MAKHCLIDNLCAVEKHCNTMLSYTLPKQGSELLLFKIAYFCYYQWVVAIFVGHF